MNNFLQYLKRIYEIENNTTTIALKKWEPLLALFVILWQLDPSPPENENDTKYIFYSFDSRIKTTDKSKLALNFFLSLSFNVL